MLVRYRQPWFLSGRIDNEFDRIVADAFGRGTAAFAPAADVVTEGEDVVVTLSVPGVAPEDIDVTLDGRKLVVSGERVQPELAEGDRVVERGLRHGAFRRVFTVPAGTTSEQISAEAKHGLLKVRVARATKPESQPQKIAVYGAPEVLEVEAAEEPTEDK